MQSSATLQPFLGFTIGEHGLAIRLSEVMDVSELRDIRPVPGAPPIVRGVANLRGRAITVLDTAELLYVREEPSRWAARLAPPRENLALALGSDVDIFRVEAGTLQRAPDPSGISFEEAVSGERVWQLLSLSAIVSRLDEEMVTALSRTG